MAAIANSPGNHCRVCEIVAPSEFPLITRGAEEAEEAEEDNKLSIINYQFPNCDRGGSRADFSPQSDFLLQFRATIAILRDPGFKNWRSLKSVKIDTEPTLNSQVVMGSPSLDGNRPGQLAIGLQAIDWESDISALASTGFR